MFKQVTADNNLNWWGYNLSPGAQIDGELGGSKIIWRVEPTQPLPDKSDPAFVFALTLILKM